MKPHAPTDLNWAARVAKIVSEALLFSKFIAWRSFDPTLERATAAIRDWIEKHNYPAANKDRDSWIEGAAGLVGKNIVEAGLVAAEDRDRALDLLIEEITTTLNLGDRPGRRGPEA